MDDRHTTRASGRATLPWQSVISAGPWVSFNLDWTVNCAVARTSQTLQVSCTTKKKSPRASSLLHTKVLRCYRSAVKSCMSGNWTELHWNGKDALVADRPTSQATFEFTGTQIGVYVWASGRKDYGAGAALCWVGASWEKGVYVDSSQSLEDSDGPRYAVLSLPTT